MWHEQQKLPDVSGEKATSNELVGLIRKLRWMGMDEEAKTAENQLALRTGPVADSVVARSRETD